MPDPLMDDDDEEGPKPKRHRIGKTGTTKTGEEVGPSKIADPAPTAHLVKSCQLTCGRLFSRYVIFKADRSWLVQLAGAARGTVAGWYS